MIDSGPALTKNHEGYVEGVYLDSLGHPTTGYGLCLEPVLSFHTVKEWHEHKFQEEYAKAEKAYDTLGLDLDAVRRSAVVDLLYNLGLTKLLKFIGTLGALKMKDWLAAANHLENSAWYKQVGRRGKRICKLIRDGVWESLET